MFTAAAQVLAMGPLHVDVPLLPLTAAGRLSAAPAEDGLHSVGVKPNLALPTELLEIHLTGSRDAPHISTLPPDVALLTVEESIPLFKKL